MWSESQTFHFIGIGGIGVSAVARVLHQRGVRIQGSDVRESSITEALREMGVPVTIGHSPENIANADVIVHSTAVPEDNVERLAAKAQGKLIAHRSNMLGWCLEGTDSVGVTGTHGKGTVSAMITHGLITAGKDPTFVIGGMLQNYRTNSRCGADPVCVAEVDESDRSHLNLTPNRVVVNNLEVDHLNFYDGLEDIVDTMARFISRNRVLETLALNWDDAGVRALAEKIGKPDGADIVKYGAGDGPLDYAARDVEDLGDRVAFTLERRGETLGRITLPLSGSYNAENAAGAAAILMEAYALPFEVVKQALDTYRGLENRFTVRRAGPLTLVKDYISHPTGMRRVLESARKIEHRRIWTVFKPYRFTLMKYHGEEYAEVFREADEVVITKMYAAEERPIDGIDTPWFVELLKKEGCSVHYVEANADVVGFIEPRVEPGDMVVFFGGDDFFRMADAWADRVEQGSA